MRPIDDELIRALAQTVIDLLAAIERGEKLEVIGQVSLMLNLMVEHRDARPQDRALVRAVERV